VKGKVMTKKMDVSKAIDIVEGLRDPNDEYEALEAWQVLVDTDMAWKLQGRIGRTAQEMLDYGYLRPKKSELH
jgi:hypothetical protein